MDPPKLLYELLLEVVTDLDFRANEFDDGSVEEIAADLQEPVVRVLWNQQSAHDQHIPTYEIFGSSLEYIRGASRADPTLDDDTNTVRARRLHIDQVQAELQQLKWQEFEDACGTVLNLLGCIKPTVSPRSGDGGIDFYGLLKLENRLDNFNPLGGFDQDLCVWLVGQAKHYSGKVGTAVVRELVGSVELARTRGTSKVWPDLHLRAFDPVVLLVFTTGEFSEDALSLLKDSGVQFMDGFQFAKFLTDNGVGLTDLENFQKEQFRNALLRKDC